MLFSFINNNGSDFNGSARSDFNLNNQSSRKKRDHNNNNAHVEPDYGSIVRYIYIYPYIIQP